ncbi:hypothetical protein [Vibrio phage vB_VibM_83AMN]|nr:hypothetical protein [Vibrio phage vB_VibM_83AMN]
MSVIVEDGSNVVGANSFITIDELRSFASIRNIILPTDENQLTSLLILSCEYLNTLDAKLKGTQTYSDQELSWPRDNICNVPKDSIPKAVKNAQLQLSLDCLANDGTLMPNVTQYAIKHRKLGPMATTYAVGSGTNSKSAKPMTPQYTLAMSHIKKYMKPFNGNTVYV